MLYLSASALKYNINMRELREKKLVNKTFLKTQHLDTIVEF